MGAHQDPKNAQFLSTTITSFLGACFHVCLWLLAGGVVETDVCMHCKVTAGASGSVLVNRQKFSKMDEFGKVFAGHSGTWPYVVKM